MPQQGWLKERKNNQKTLVQHSVSLVTHHTIASLEEEMSVEEARQPKNEIILLATSLPPGKIENLQLAMNTRKPCRKVKVTAWRLEAKA